MEFTYYQRPNGKSSILNMTEINSEDEEWFVERNIKISIEELTENNFAVYADSGNLTEDDEPEEIVVMSFGRDCRAVMHNLRIECSKTFYDGE